MALTNADRCRSYRRRQHDRDMLRDMVRDTLRDMLPEIIQLLREELRHAYRHGARHAAPSPDKNPPDPQELTLTLDSPGVLRTPAPKGRVVVSRADFERLWHAYPSRSPHSNPKEPAWQKFQREVQRGADPEDIIAGATRYCESIIATGTDPRHVAQAMTWINQRRWISEAGTANGHDDAQPLLPIDHPQRVAERESALAKIRSELGITTH